MLIDGGPDEEQVATELAALGVKRLDVVVASHPHADHVVGLPTVLARFQVGSGAAARMSDRRRRCRSSSTGRSPTRASPVRTPRTGSSYAVGDLRLDILSPHECWTGTESDTNNDALVVMLSRGEDTVLFATEPEEPAQEWLARQRPVARRRRAEGAPSRRGDVGPRVLPGGARAASRW